MNIISNNEVTKFKNKTIFEDEGDEEETEYLRKIDELIENDRLLRALIYAKEDMDAEAEEEEYLRKIDELIEIDRVYLYYLENNKESETK